MTLPSELMDRILAFTDFDTASKMNSRYAMRKLYDPNVHTLDRYAALDRVHALDFILEGDSSGSCVYDAVLRACANGCILSMRRLAEHMGCVAVADDAEFRLRVNQECCMTSYTTTVYAASKGFTDVMEFLWRQGVPVTCDTYRCFEEMPVDDWIDTHRADEPGMCHSAINYAAVNGHAEAVDWLVRHGVVPDETTLCLAVASKRREVTKLLLDSGLIPLGGEAMHIAVRAGDLEAMIMLKDYGAELDCRVFRTAGAAGHLGVMQWLLANGCAVPLDIRGVLLLAGHVDIIGYYGLL